jgi:hypothetical protein
MENIIVTFDYVRNDNDVKQSNIYINVEKDDVELDFITRFYNNVNTIKNLRSFSFTWENEIKKYDLLCSDFHEKPFYLLWLWKLTERDLKSLESDYMDAAKQVLQDERLYSDAISTQKKHPMKSIMNKNFISILYEIENQDAQIKKRLIDLDYNGKFNSELDIIEMFYSSLMTRELMNLVSFQFQFNNTTKVYIMGNIEQENEPFMLLWFLQVSKCNLQTIKNNYLDKSSQYLQAKSDYFNSILNIG